MYAHFNLRKAPKRKDLGIASKVSPVNLIVLVSLIRIPQFSPLYLIEPFSAPGSPYDNAVAESLFSKAKIESLGGKVFKNIKELEQEVFSYVWWYNNKRYHSSLNYMTPVEYRSVCLNLC